MPFDLSQVFATLKGLITRQPFAVGGSGSSYVYGFVDAEYRRGMNKEDCQQFVVNSKLISTENIFHQCFESRSRMPLVLTVEKSYVI